MADNLLRQFASTTADLTPPARNGPAPIGAPGSAAPRARTGARPTAPPPAATKPGGNAVPY